jgi:hypothetical protein
MSKPHVCVETDELGTKLLCRSYDLVTLDVVGVELGVPLVLATGFLSDGRCDLLGCWPAVPACQDSVDSVVAQLKLRGVERVRFLLSSGSVYWEFAFKLAFQASVFDFAWQLVGSLGKRPMTVIDIRRVCAVRQLTGHQGLLTRRAVARHGAFADLQQAVAFVLTSFRRVEREQISLIPASPATSARRLVAA